MLSIVGKLPQTLQIITRSFTLGTPGQPEVANHRVQQPLKCPAAKHPVDLQHKPNPPQAMTLLSC
ncbi:hypothetical protein D3C78_1609590 [compost metagenome]